MPDDDVTMVRARLWRLLGRGAEPPRRPATGRSAGGPAPGEAERSRWSTSGRSTSGAAPGEDDTVAAGPAFVDDPGPAGPALVDDEPDPAAPAAPRLAGAGAFDPGRRGVKALAVVAAVVVLGAAGWAWHARPRTEPVAASSSSGSAAPLPAAQAGPSAAADQAEVVVAVAGKVRRPGLVRLPAGARVADALDAAGGALPGVDVALLNLARKVSDGELLLVGVAAPPGVAGQPAGAGAVPGAAPGAASGGKVNLNTATLAQLDGLPGVGPVLAQRILDHREQHGGFRSIGDLRQVQGIGDARYEDLKDLVTV